MAINKLMQVALKALSYPDVDIKKALPFERTVKELKAMTLAPFYRYFDHKIVDGNREILTRFYTPFGKPVKRTLLFIHGGGWVAESVDTYNSVCQNLAQHTDSRVISVEYRLAPENPFPAGLEDCYAVAKNVMMHPDGTPGGVTIIGDSAGGNLAAAVSLLARDRSEFSVGSQILIYPALYHDYSESSPFQSVRDNGSDYLLTSKRISEYMEMYMRTDADFKSPYFAPLNAGDLTNQPKTLIITAEYDPLRDEGEEYGRRLSKAGIQSEIYRMEDALHGFFSLSPRYVHVRRAYKYINHFLTKI